MRVLDLFAGCGGMSLGFQNAGFEIMCAYDHWEPAVRVYRQNFAHPIRQVDLRAFNGEAAWFAPYQPEMIIGGPPCQDFSSAGKRDESLGRADLTVLFAEIVAALSPQWFVMENVDRALKSRSYGEAVRVFRSAAYGLTEMILDASYCGVPQKRKRLFLIGALNGVENGLKPLLTKHQAPQRMTMRAFFGEALGIDHYYRHPRSYARRAVFSMDEPSPTIRGVNRPIPSSYVRHPGDTAAISQGVRPLTTQERSLVQTFPHDFVLTGSKSDQEQLIGNAVPVKLAEYVGRCLAEYIAQPSLAQPVQLGLFSAASP